MAARVRCRGSLLHGPFDSPYHLLAHSALVGVAWRLVVVRVRYQPRTHAEDRQRVDFEMGVPAAAAAAAAAIATAAAYSAHARQELRLVHRDFGGIFLVHVEVLDDPLTDEIVPRPRPRAKLGHVLRGELRAARVAHDYEWPADTPRVGSDVDAAVNRVELDGNELAQPAGAAQLAHRREQLLRLAMRAKDQAV